MDFLNYTRINKALKIISHLEDILNDEEKKCFGLLKVDFNNKILDFNKRKFDKIDYTLEEYGRVKACLKKIIFSNFNCKSKLKRKLFNSLCDKTVLPNEIICAKILLRRRGNICFMGRMEKSVNDFIHSKMIEVFTEQHKEIVKKYG